VQVVGDSQLAVNGHVKEPMRFDAMEVLAPHPIDRRASYSGSGLPFPCPTIALTNTPNRTSAAPDGRFMATFSYPNSYYSYDGKTKIKPSIFFALKPKGQNPEDTVFIRFELPEHPALFFRTLTHRPGRTGPGFYGDKDSMLDPIPRSAEQVMRSFIEYKAKFDKAI
jgi:hypothetical protein